MEYAELQVISNFTLLEGASHADELIIQAKILGLKAIGIADRNSLAGVVRAHKAAKAHHQRLLIGARLDLQDGPSLVAYPENRAAYGRLSQLITLGRRRAEKGECELYLKDVLSVASEMRLIQLVTDPASVELKGQLDQLHNAFPNHIYLSASHLLRGDDQQRIQMLAELSQATGVKLLATNDVIMHVTSRRPLADILTCIKEKCTIDEAGRRVQVNAERHLKSPIQMEKLFTGHEEALAHSLEIVDACTFSLDELSYSYPTEIMEPGLTAQQSLEKLTWEGAQKRYPRGIPDKAREVIEHELELVKGLNYAPYFLTVYDLVKFARNGGTEQKKEILCQGRGSAANSTICYCLGITSIDPIHLDLLFERFISPERNEPPDIDVDFEHERREEVIQYIYEKYGRHRAGMTAVVSCYRARGAIREVGKAMGLSEDTVGLLSSQIFHWGKGDEIKDEMLSGVGLDPKDYRLRLTINLIHELIGFPRHLGQHVGGFVMTDDRLDTIVPIENAAMDDRTVIQWDKDDLDELGILKVDVLSLGMLTCIRKCFDMISSHYGKQFTLATLPQEDSATYDMLCVADAIGVFQVESRAQLSFLPRMKPRNFYDLVIEVAIVRPGPIQGDMVHPYLRRRNGEEPVSYPSKELKRVLAKTLGVPLFQEQAMKIAIVGAGFTPSEADQLRRSMATFKHTGTISTFYDKFVQGMVRNGYQQEFAERCFRQIEGFGEYGFPESHAASFALLVYVSAWIKKHYPAVFACGLINSQPMGFYAPAQIVRDAKDHGVEVRPPDVNYSDWDCSLEPAGAGYAIRLGLRLVKGLHQDDGDWIASARGNGYRIPHDLWRRANIGKRPLNALARADALQSMELKRREALWEVKAINGNQPLPLFEATGEQEYGEEAAVSLPEMTLGEEVVSDYSFTRLSLKAHPVGVIRPFLPVTTKAEELSQIKDGSMVTAMGLVIVRQRPGSAKGVIFLTIEDETGTANLIVWPDMFDKYRKEIFTSRFIRVKAELQREGIVTHLVIKHLEDLSSYMDELASGRYDKVEADKDNHPMVKTAPSNLGKHPRNIAQQLFPSRDFH
ncbi:error-prone DNA polymerase [Curvivirga sp.]|uniref:error-prone DNA polymerase n=1 Tax=Curvivirga sp. TaxID=2856848 RepID=UPI003B5C2F4E